MNFYKRKKAFISLVCVISLILSMISVPVAAADTNSVTATTNASIKQGNYGYCYVNIDSTEGLAALDVSVHFDPAKVKITDVYNSVSCTLYDSVTNTDNIQFSYILDGQGTASKTRLFYFQYQVLSGAEIGDDYFDITIGEAYDSALNDVSVSGSRCKFTITEAVTNKTCSAYGTSSVSTSVEQEFTLDYRFSTYQIASGTAVITYDSELFEVVEVTPKAFLTNKVVDVNSDFTGEIYISFVGTEYYSDKNFVSVKFRTIKNVADTSKIVLKTPELLDKDLNPISCTGYTTNVTVSFDESYVGDAPTMSLDGSFSYDDMQITLVVSLEEMSNLGAGDFEITFDPELVSYNSCEKGFEPSFFYINDKDAEDGKIKFHIISLSDIVTEETVLTIVFDVNHPYGCKTADFTLDGTGLTNSLTESILLNFLDDSVLLEYLVTFCNWNGTLLTSTLYHFGDVVQEPDTPTRESDVYGTYTFAGWDKPITECVADEVYTAVYDIEYTDYTITFLNWDGTEISKQTYHYGDAITAPANPTKAADNTYTYTFDGWDKTVVDCVGDATYTATYTSSYIDYTVVFKDWNGDVLSTKTYHYGDKVTLPANPNRVADKTYTYTFTGWDNNVESCTGDIVYTATYKKEYTEYTVVFQYEDGTVISTQNYHYGDTVTVPENVNALNKGYVFIGWDKEVTICRSDAIYTAVFERKYVLGDMDGDETVTQDDAVYLLLHTMFGETFYPLNSAPADFDKDGKVTQEDAVYLLLHTMFGETFYPISK